MKRLWLCSGCWMVVGGGSAATMGYLAAREAATMQTLVASNAESAKTQATTRKSTAVRDDAQEHIKIKERCLRHA
jgi:hypothetical protein